MLRTKFLILFSGTMLLGLLPVAAQEAPPSAAKTLTPEALAQLLQQLRAQDARLQELEAQVAQLKSAQASKGASESSAPPANSAAPSTEAGAVSTPSEAHPTETVATPTVETPQDATPPEPAINHVLGPVQFNGFSDIDYGRAWFELLPPGGLKDFPNSFAIGDFDLFTNTRLSERWSMLGEMLATTDFSNETSVELDRLLLTDNRNEDFKISFGKFDTSLGYYTTDVHRAQFFQTPIGRPIMYSDEDSNGILPVHNIGVTAGGLIPSGKLGLHWAADIANGRSSTNPDVPIQNFVDDNNGKATTVALYARPDWLSGFQTGVSIYHDVFHPVGLPQVGEEIVTVHVVCTGSKLEWLNEGAVLRHAVDGGDVLTDTSAYTQVSWKFGKTRPYFRYDYQNIAAGDPLYGFLGRRNGASFGIAQRLTNYVVFKIQYGRLAMGNVSNNDFLTQLAFAF